MDKTVVSKLVKSNSNRIKLVANESEKSDVWSSFVKVYLDDMFSNFVKCSTCCTLLKWKGKDGTSGLKAHTKACLSQRRDSTVTPLASF